MSNNISATTSLYGVIGSPIKHSLSPKIYNTGFSHHNIDSVYMAFECDEVQVSDTLASVRLLNIKGINVTMPCKRACFEQVDRVEGAAKYVGAVNTIKNENGTLIGHITDGMGLVLDLKDHGVDIKDKSIVLIGVGGAGCAIMAQCALDGAKSIHVFNRGQNNLAKAKEIGDKMNSENINCSFSYNLLSENDTLNTAIKNADILINSSSVGMAPNSDATPVPDTTCFHKNLVVYDVIYNPQITRLMSEATNYGCKVIGGKGMLVWQAYGAFNIYTGLELPVDKLRSI